MSPSHTSIGLKAHLESLYYQYNRRGLIQPDPLQFLYDYPHVGDREIAGFVAASFAYGRVQQILLSVSWALERMGPSPRAYLREASHEALSAAFSGFKHRFSTGEELASMLFGLKEAIDRYGSLNACFRAQLKAEDETVLPALAGFVRELARGDNGRPNSLLPLPERGSACKRLNLFLRWIVRQDDVDPGGWTGVRASKLIVPIDIHMHRIGLALGLTRRNHADMRTALEITAGFRKMVPEDPVRYDFALTRLGIRRDGDLDSFLRGTRDHLDRARR